MNFRDHKMCESYCKSNVDKCIHIKGFVKNCDNCKHYCWYYDWCYKFEIEVDGREVHDCFEDRD